MEIDPFCQKVLKKHWPNVPIVKDVNNVEEIVAYTELCRYLHGETSKYPTERQYQAQRNAPPDIQSSLLLTAGFPCQPFSAAGRRKGSADDRYLWPQTLAVIEAVKPDWVLLENVAGILSMVFSDSAAGVASQASLFQVPNDEIADYDTISGRIDGDLSQAGYETVWLVIPACAVNAPHRRDRVWIIGNALGESRWQTTKGRLGMAGELLQETRRNEDTDRIAAPSWQEHWYEVATRFCRVDDGVPNRVDRLKALGNAIVPQVAYEIIKAIVEGDGTLGELAY